MCLFDESSGRKLEIRRRKRNYVLICSSLVDLVHNNLTKLV